MVGRDAFGLLGSFPSSWGALATRRPKSTRLGADIGLVCAGCGHRILMDRLDVERRFTEFLARGPEPSA